MKKKTMRMLSAALAVTLLSGCGAAQTNTPAETSVNQAMLLEKSAQPQESAYTFPEKFTGDWTGQEGKLTIHADAQVVAELGTALPTATVEPREFNQEDVDNLLKVFLKGGAAVFPRSDQTGAPRAPGLYQFPGLDIGPRKAQ